MFSTVAACASPADSSSQTVKESRAPDMVGLLYHFVVISMTSIQTLAEKPTIVVRY
jgi:hypothetical protein